MNIDHSRFLNPKEEIKSIKKAGEGNMNVVFRVQTDQRSIILKQAKPYVVKYPTIPAPIDRIFTEAAFYQAIEYHQILMDRSPKILNFFSDDYTLVMEDLGEASDYTWIYQNHQVEESLLQMLIIYLNQLHKVCPVKFPSNQEMKVLNHEHIFLLPFDENNGLNLDQFHPGLQQVARLIHQNQELKSFVHALGQHYLASSQTLIHGDFYPGSWLKTQSGLKIIDPEFGYLGYPEFDLAVMLAHLKLAKTDIDGMSFIKKYYTNPFDKTLVRQWEGIEIIRRLIGVAQLPLSLNLNEKESLLIHAVNQILPS